MAAFDHNPDVMAPWRFLPKVAGPADVQFVGNSPAMKALELATREVAASPLPVLVLGDSGTGKKALSLRIHAMSPWADLALATIECPQLRNDQHSFDALIQAVNGEVSNAEVGTIVVDEISSLDLQNQAQLYEFVISHLGRQDGTRRKPKLIFTSSKNLEQEIRLGRFREDLYYLLSGVCLRVPPLRHRKEDIPILADIFVTKYAALLHRPKPVLSESTMRFLCEYSWPGNVRELEDAARTIAAVGDDKIAITALRSAQRNVKRQNGRIPLMSLKEASRAASRAAEKELILKVLSRTQWNRKRAAEELKISYKALLYKLKQIGMHEPDAAVERELG